MKIAPVRGVSSEVRICAYLSTSESTAEEMVVQSLVYLTVLIHSFETISIASQVSCVPVVAP
jgi:hypothetical protein